LFLFTSVQHGGFGFSPQKISLFLGLVAASQAFWILVLFPPLQRKLGTNNLLRICIAAWPTLFGSFPIMNEFLRNGWNHAYWIAAALSITIGGGAAMSSSESNALSQ
jgi:MFS-type transporter involved in bile tolerance (Atg22 family)